MKKSFTTFAFALIVSVTILGGTSSLAQSPCSDSLGYLASQIPTTGNAQLDGMRQQILATNIAEIKAKMAAQGLSAIAAATQANAQVQLYRNSMLQLEATISGAAGAGPGASIIRSLKARDYSNLPMGEDVLGAAVKSYIAYDWGALTNAETARQLQCR